MATVRERKDMENKGTNKTRGMRRKRGLNKICQKDDDDDCWCLVCEDWVQCQKCELWSHFACSDTTLITRALAVMVAQIKCCILPRLQGTFRQLHRAL
jgi:hypothetical protein